MYFAPEFVKGLVEVNAPPVHTPAGLEREYAKNLRLAVGAARSLGLRLYPLGTYPLPLVPVVRDGLGLPRAGRHGRSREVRGRRTLRGHAPAPRAAGGTVDADVGLVADAPADALDEVISLHNLATALDPALVALTRSCPYYEGRASGLAARTVHYRGSAAFGWEGVYTDLPQVGALLPYAGDANT
jgi:carboxylate-amine ligase